MSDPIKDKEQEEAIKRLVNLLQDDLMECILIGDKSIDEVIEDVAEHVADECHEEIEGCINDPPMKHCGEAKETLTKLIQIKDNPRRQHLILALYLVGFFETVSLRMHELMRIWITNISGLELNPGDEVPTKTEFEFIIEKHLRKLIEE